MPNKQLISLGLRYCELNGAGTVEKVQHGTSGIVRRILGTENTTSDVVENLVNMRHPILGAPCK
jgi:hypothetical protein